MEILQIYYAGGGFSEVKEALDRIMDHLKCKRASKTALAAEVIQTLRKTQEPRYGVLFTTKMIRWIAEKLDPDAPDSMMDFATAVCEAITSAWARGNYTTGGLNVAPAGMALGGSTLVKKIWQHMKKSHHDIMSNLLTAEEKMEFLWTKNALKEFEGKQTLLDAIGLRYPRRTDVTVGELVRDICAAGGMQSHRHLHNLHTHTRTHIHRSPFTKYT